LETSPELLNRTKEINMDHHSTKLPTFETKRLLLKEVTIEHADSYQKHFAHYEVIRHLSSAVPWPYPAGGAKSFIEELIVPNQGNDRWLWGIFLKDQPSELIGAVDLWRKGRPEHRGFWLSKDHWGKGIMTEAVLPVMEYAFTKLGFEKLVFANAVGNERSRRIKVKTGATFIEAKPFKFVDPAFTEHEIWELTKADWIKNRVAS